MAPIEHVIGLSALLFGIGAAGALFRRNALVVLMCIQLMLAAVLIALAGFDRVFAERAAATATSTPADGRTLALLVVVVAAAQVAVGLGIFVAGVRSRDSVDVESARQLRW